MPPKFGVQIQETVPEIIDSGPMCITHLSQNKSVVDVLCRQQIKLFQVVSTSEFHEY